MAEGLFHEAILDGPGAAHTPIGRGHFLNHAELDAIGRGEAPRGKNALPPMPCIQSQDTTETFE